MADFNEQWYHEDALLLMLYSLKSLDSKELESFFANRHEQYANNAISNRSNSTSHFAKGWMRYDDTNQTVLITEAGKREVERRYSSRRQ